MSFDVCSWILSPEIREYWQKNYLPSIVERQTLIRTAYRPMEERLEVLRALLKEAETEQERRAIGEDIRLFQYALREIHNTSPGKFFILRHPYIPHTLDWVGWPNTGMYASFQALLDDLDGKNGSLKSFGFMVEKWDTTGEKPEEMFTFDLHFIEDKPAITNLYVNPRQQRWVKVRRAVINRDNYGICKRHPYPLPFAAGALVKLDAPMLRMPLYGVLYNGDDSNGGPCVIMGHMFLSRRGLRFGVLDLSYDGIEDGGWGLRVIDWLHRARISELPKGQKVLGDISLYLRHLRRKDRFAAREMFFHIFGELGEREAGHIIPATLSELTVKKEEAYCVSGE